MKCDVKLHRSGYEISVCLVCAVHCVIAKGKVTAGMVFALLSVPPASLCFIALMVVADAVPANGCTYCTKFCACNCIATEKNIAITIIFFVLPALVILLSFIGVALLYIRFSIEL